MRAAADAAVAAVGRLAQCAATSRLPMTARGFHASAAPPHSASAAGAGATTATIPGWRRWVGRRHAAATDSADATADAAVPRTATTRRAAQGAAAMAAATATTWWALARAREALPTCASTITTPAQCAEASDALVRAVVSAPWRSYTRERLYTVEVAGPAADSPVIILLPGYGSGAAQYAWMLDSLATRYHVYCVDWLGTGASERPPFPASPTVEEAERWFTAPLADWLAATPGLAAAPFTLLGHSLGGYLAGGAVLASPDLRARCSHLVLLSPAGVPTALPPQMEAALQQRGWLLSVIAWAWEKNVTPQGLARAVRRVGGTDWINNVLARRFASAVPPAHLPYLAAYLSAITFGAGSGEKALSPLLAFGARAKSPLGPRLTAAAATGGAAALPPTTFIYGGGWDWMPPAAGAEVAASLASAGINAAAATVPQSGHNLHMEQPHATAAAILARGAALRITA